MGRFRRLLRPFRRKKYPAESGEHSTSQQYDVSSDVPPEPVQHDTAPLPTVTLERPASDYTNDPFAATTAKPNGHHPETHADDSANHSLWDQAYDALDRNLIAAYEDLLSRALDAQLNRTHPNDTTEVPNEIPQHNTTARREKLKSITKLGLQHMEDRKISKTLLGHEIVLQDAVANVAGVVTWVEKHVKDALKDLPYASIVMAGVSLVLPLLKNPTAEETANQDGFTYVTSQMRYYDAMESLLLADDMKSELKSDLQLRVVDLYTSIIDFQARSIIRFYRSRTKNYFRGAIKYDDWEQVVAKIRTDEKDLISKCETAISSSTFQELRRLEMVAEDSRQLLSGLLLKAQEQIDVSQEQLGVSRSQLGVLKKITELIRDPQDRACRQDLRITNPSDDKSRIERDKGGLLRDAYVWVLQNKDFKKWLEPRQESGLLWIKGDPGKGKTMLLCGIINELLKPRTDSATISFFFCQATDARINSATSVLRGLIYLLVVNQPQLISHVRQRYDEAGEQLFKDKNAWEALSKIFTSMLEDPQMQSSYLIVDALDECIEGLDKLLNLIVEKSSTHPSHKWIVSSRNWPNIEKGLRGTTQKVKLSLELNAESVSAAVDTYIRFKVEKLIHENRYNSAIRDTIQHYLLANANGTFLWVALVCRELTKLSDWEVEEELTKFPPKLDDLYARMICDIRASKHAELCQRILRVVALVRRPLTLDELVSMVDMPSRAVGNDQALEEIIGYCGSFLTLRERIISLVHQSVKDFLMDKATNDIFPSGVENAHHTIFLRSFQAISKSLYSDIYHLRAPGFLIHNVKVPDPDPIAAARYSCIYWADHLVECRNTIPTRKALEDNGLIDTFLREKYLNWLEALSLLKCLSQGVSAMLNLQRLAQSENQISSLVIDRVRDACRFLLYSKSGIENCPLQAYSSALIFSPESSITKNQYERPAWVTQAPIVDRDWNACRQTVEGHDSMVNSVTFSPDGQLIASASDDKTVKVWDAATGAEQQILAGYSGRVNSVAFSPDGQLIASASDDKTVKVWDVATGAEQQTLVGHSGWTSSVVFSPDGQLVISASGDKTVKVWDAATGAERQTLAIHDGTVRSVAFSPDGKLVASASDDKTVKVWDAATGAERQTLAGHGDSVRSVAFSPDGQLVASASGDKTVKVWDTATGAQRQTLAGHGDWVNSVAFSPDGKLVASASGDETVKVWDTATGAERQTFAGHGDWVSSVAFSPDGQLVASASGDETVKVWDMATGAKQQTFAGHSGTVNSVAFAGHNGTVNSVAFSPDGQLVASASDDETVKVWDVVTGAERQTLVGHNGWVRSVAFSPDGKLVASASDDETVKVWDVVTGAERQTLVGHNGWVRSVAFSPDGKLVASASDDKTVKVWDATTGQKVQTLEGHRAYVRSVTFSPDGKLVASASDDETVKVWDAATGQELQTTNIGTSSSTLSFSPDSLSILTDIGTISIRSQSSQSLLPQREAVHLGPGISEDRSWITWCGNYLLWLPPDFRPITSAVSGSLVTIGCPSGRVFFMQFAREELSNV